LEGFCNGHKTPHQTHLSSSLGAKNEFCAMFTLKRKNGFWVCLKTNCEYFLKKKQGLNVSEI
jgi:hypothetical protein